MRLVVSESIGYMNDELSFLYKDMHKYNWIFLDIVGHVILGETELRDTIFNQKKFCMSGKDLYDFLQKYQVLLIFGVLIAVESSDRKVLENITDYSAIEGNENYWKDDFFLTIPASIMEICFFDTSYLFFASKDEGIIERFRKQFPISILYSEYFKP